MAGHHEELAELREGEGLVEGSEAGIEVEEGAKAGGGTEEGDGGLAGLDGGQVEVEQVGIAGEEGLNMDGEAEALAALLEVAEGDGLAGLVENLADHAGAEPPPLVPVDGGVQQRVLAPRDLEARDRGCPAQEPGRRAKEAAAEEEVRQLQTRRQRGHSVLLDWRRQVHQLQ